MTDNKIYSVSEDVTWIGVLDKDIVTFDIVMETKYGTTYNSYFINAEKKVIIETVKESFWEVWLEKIKKVVDPSEIDYIVLNHTEPDHSGCLARLLEIAPKAVVIGSGNAIRYLNDLVGKDFQSMVVKDGQELDLGNKKLKFIGAPNLHWPDSMFTYLIEDQVLFTCDVFGEHYCNEVMFDDLAGNFDDAFHYYFEVIMKPFSKFMLSAIEKIRPLPIRTICPGHGMILRSDWKKYVDLSERYAQETLCFPIPNTVFLAYVSAYRNTGLIAEAIAEGIRQAGNIEVDVCDIEKMDLPAIEEKLIRSSSFILGSPTFSQNILLPVYQVFALINPIRDRGKLAAAFGSYGWSGEGTKIISTTLNALKLKVIDDGLMIKFTPHQDSRQKCMDYGKAFGEKLLAKE
ncbi:MAG TPA: FprA family A-type flavoprotein [Bacteroidales bacterium]|nr:FprA family A-type flavoprotein [Bacteroidales bacterium]